MVLNNVEFFICTNVIQMRLVCVTEDWKYFQLFSVYSESPHSPFVINHVRGYLEILVRLLAIQIPHMIVMYIFNSYIS